MTGADKLDNSKLIGYITVSSTVDTTYICTVIDPNGQTVTQNVKLDVFGKSQHRLNFG